jgi:hypothetical protein
VACDSQQVSQTEEQQWAAVQRTAETRDSRFWDRATIHDIANVANSSCISARHDSRGAMRRLNLVLLASLQLAQARQPSFSIHDDVLAHPEVCFQVEHLPALPVQSTPMRP